MKTISSGLRKDGTFECPWVKVGKTGQRRKRERTSYNVFWTSGDSDIQAEVERGSSGHSVQLWHIRRMSNNPRHESIMCFTATFTFTSRT